MFNEKNKTLISDYKSLSFCDTITHEKKETKEVGDDFYEERIISASGGL